MAASELSVKSISRAGLDLAGSLTTWNADGMYFLNTMGTRTFLLIYNGSASPITLTITVQKKVDGITPTARSVAVAAGKYTFVGPFAADEYNDASGYVQLPAAVAASTSVAALYLPW